MRALLTLLLLMFGAGCAVAPAAAPAEPGTNEAPCTPLLGMREALSRHYTYLSFLDCADASYVAQRTVGGESIDALTVYAMAGEQYHIEASARFEPDEGSGASPRLECDIAPACEEAALQIVEEHTTERCQLTVTLPEAAPFEAPHACASFDIEVIAYPHADYTIAVRRTR